MGTTASQLGPAPLPAVLKLSPAIGDALARLGSGTSCPAPDACPSSHAFIAAAAHHLHPDRVVVLILDGLKAQESALQDLNTWLGITAGSGGEPLFYPDWEVLPHEPKLPHVDVVSERLSTLSKLATAGARTAGSAPLVVTTVTALLQRTYAPAALRARLKRIDQGSRLDPLDLVEWLEGQGYEPEAQVTQKGTLSLRGGILDVWSPSAPWPVRIEFFGDDVESLREFDPQTQLSRERISGVQIVPAGELGILRQQLAAASDEGREGTPPEPLATFLDHLPGRALLLLSDAALLAERAEAYAAQIPSGHPFFCQWPEVLAQASASGHSVVELAEASPETRRTVVIEERHGTDARGPSSPEIDFTSLEFFRPLGARAPDPAVAEAQRREFFQQMHRWMRSGLALHVFCNNEGERQRFGEIWAEQGFGDLDSAANRTGALAAPMPASGRLHLHLGALARGFLSDQAGFVVVTDAEIFGRYKVLRPRRLKSPHAQVSRSLLDIDFTEFEEGDFVVHVEHGIGRFVGLQTAPETPGHRGARTGPGAECLVIEYAASHPDDPAPRLYVPISEAHLVSKYVGAGKARPPLNTLGGTRWTKAKKEAERAVADLAAELLEIQAARETETGHAFPPDNAWQREFESSFVYEETPDQLRAIEAAKADLERPRPMDRLICGDVGFGKTEVAIRAAFKAVMGGRQVAVLVPTTVLAQQHYNNLSERMSDYPVRVELLSRFRSRREQRAVLEKLAAGSVDIVVGTHRLLQKDVAFKELGLVVVDEEQRFGVLHKERFKSMRRTVDVLTLSATPIPRTLYLALSGARDLSTIETPPQDRLPIETVVSAYDERLIRDAIQRELNRQGQVFFLHNRVGTIDTMAVKLRALVPDARLVIGHGQMDPDELEEVMTRFVNGEADILLSTTIIESGLDIPNANTIIIDRADRFGLSELYQLRGRVGRYKHQAYAYLLIPRHAQLLSEARKRIAAIRQYSSLGSGFKIAMRDLEIRGAGNLLGPQQSGHITAVGFDLYCQLLKQSISALKGEKVRPRVEVQVRLDFLALNPAEEGAAPATAPARAGRGTPETRPPAPESLPRSVASFSASYIPDSKHRVEMHRRLAQIVTPSDLRRLKEDLRDRFGPTPPAAELLLQVAELKIFASILGIEAIESREDKLMLTRNGQLIQVGGRFPRLTKREAKARLNEIRKFLAALSPT